MGRDDSFRGQGDLAYGPANIPAASGTPAVNPHTADPYLFNLSGGGFSPATVQPAIDPGVTNSGTGNPTTSPFSPITYSPTSITNPQATGGGEGINPTYLIIGIIAIIGIAAYFMVKK